jgi:hypothetical protein
VRHCRKVMSEIPAATCFNSGSTVPYVVDRIIQQGDKVNKGRVFIPTGAPRFSLALVRLTSLMHRVPVKGVDREGRLEFG